MPQIIVLPHEVLCSDGAVIQAEPGQSICDALLQNNVNIEHACDKACACTTCHVIIHEGQNSLNPADELEEDRLDKAWGLCPSSRLSCQAILADQDLVIELPKYTVNYAREE